MGAVVKLPDVHQNYYLARRTLNDTKVTREQVNAACDVLQWSGDWMDIVLVREGRNRLWSTPASENGANFNRRQEPEQLPIAAAFMVVSACMSVGSIVGYIVQSWWL